MKRTRDHQQHSQSTIERQPPKINIKLRRRRGGSTNRLFSSSFLILWTTLWWSSNHQHHASLQVLVEADSMQLYTNYNAPTTTTALLTRGGGDSKNHNNDKNVDHHHEIDDHDDDPLIGLRKTWNWAAGALFRLNEHVLAETLRDTTLSNKNPTNGRGGAAAALLVVQRKEQQQQQQASKTATNSKLSSSGCSSSSSSSSSNNSSPAQLLPWDTSRVSPMAKRLLVDDERDASKQNSTALASTNKSKTNNAANSLWWANVWAQQILDADNDNNDDHNHSMDSSSNNNNNNNGGNKDKGDSSVKKINQQSQQPASSKIEKEESAKDKSKNQSDKDKPAKSEGAETTEETSHLPQTLVTASAISPYVSSGYWSGIDQIASLGLASVHPAFRLSLRLRAARKATARLTGLHGVLSGKGRPPRQKRRRSLFLASPNRRIVMKEDDGIIPLDEDDLGMIRRRIAAIDRARETLERAAAAEAAAKRQMRWTWLFGSSDDDAANGDMKTAAAIDQSKANMTLEANATLVDVKEKTREDEKLEEKRRKEKAKEEELEEKRRKERAKQEEIEEKRRIEKAKEDERERKRRQERVMAIDKQILEGQFRLQELQCEKDALQKRHNPLWNYTTETRGNEVTYTRTFNFPAPELVEEYLEVLFWSGRLAKLNHTQLWKNAGELDDEEDDETIGDDLLTPSGDAYKLYEQSPRRQQQQQPQQPQQRQQRLPGDEIRRGNGGGGSWLLRQTIGKGGSLGEKIGEAAETAAYKGICQALMGVLARGLSALHGVNVLSYSDIRLFMEQSPDLPPVGGVLLPGSGSTGNNYAQQTLKDVMRRGARKNKRRKQNRLSDNAGIQRDAIVETLLSHCQISAPLLKLFPLAWQRALLGNIITLVAAVVTDFCEGVQFQILGHQLSFLFKPITENDVIQHISMSSGHGFNHRRARPDQFEAAVRATAEEINGNLKFLDKWHERVLGGGMLRAQIADLIARLVLTLFDEVLCGARMDLWSAQAGGPRLVAGLEYRTTPNYMDTHP